MAVNAPSSFAPKGEAYAVPHMVTIQTRLHDPVAIAAACQRLQLPAPVQGTTQLFSGAAAGLIVQLPDWRYPVVIDTQAGTVQFDNHSGRWVEQKQLDHFLQLYAVEKAKLEARKKGHQISEQTLTDGSIKLKIIAGA
jgi:hypothetical protein